MSAGLWDRWYSLIPDDAEPVPFDDSPSYQMGADWVQDCELVEDWGCGKGWLRTLVEPDRYWGVDGSSSPFADAVVDLVSYRSHVPAVFMRHVLEHNYAWRRILYNALGSFTDRMFLALFTPLGEKTYDMEWEPDPGVPNLSFRLEDITDVFADAPDVRWGRQRFKSPTKYGTESVFRLWR